MRKHICFFIAISTFILSSMFEVSYGDVEKTLYFNQSNVSGMLPSSTGFGSVTVTELTDGGLQFVIRANTDYFTENGENGLKFDKFLFNIAGNVSIDINHIDIVDIKKGASWKILSGNNDNDSNNASEFGRFKFLLHGTGNDPGLQDPLTFTLLNSALTLDAIEANSNNYTFAAHLRGFTKMYGKDSTWLGVDPPAPPQDSPPVPTPTPEPATLVLFGAGLTGIASFIRARKK